ncbi:MAG: hypothetical protein ACO1RT_05275 [Planctomycetaceae bacterium]
MSIPKPHECFLSIHCAGLDSPISRLVARRIGQSALDDSLVREETPPSLEPDNFTMMVCLPISIDLQTLRKLVQKKLCEIGMLEQDQFPLTERSVMKADRVCGVYYCLHGPRSVKLTAIADFEQLNLICYGSDGTRTVEEKLPA